MDLITEKLNGAVVLNVEKVCASHENDCKECNDFSGSVHNWLVTTGMKYVVVDLQDEKDVCPTFLVELLQLRKRHRIPFLFAGVMDRPKQLLEAYDYSFDGTPVFISPEDAVIYLKGNFSAVLNVDYSHIKIGEPVMSIRARHALHKSNEEAEETEGAEI